jgi:hypothetical protein
MTSRDEITSDPVALRDYLVEKAMEAVGRGQEVEVDDIRASTWGAIEDAMHERMAQAAQVITSEIAEAREQGAEIARRVVLACLDQVAGPATGGECLRIERLAAERNEAYAERDLAIQTREGALDAQADAALALRAELKEAEAERDAARSQLAALRAAASARTIARKLHDWSLAIRPDTVVGDVEHLDAVLADTAAAAEAHDREVAAKALEEAARDADGPRACAPIPGYRQWADWLRGRAAQTRGGK